MVLMHDHLQLRDSVGISPTSLPRGTFDLTASDSARPRNFIARPSVVSVSDAPERSGKDTVAQLVVIAILIAITIVAIIYLRSFIDSHDSMGPSSTKATFNVACCTAFTTEGVSHPGGFVRLAGNPPHDGETPIESLTNSSTA
jgi:hypothetical protein